MRTKKQKYHNVKTIENDIWQIVKREANSIPLTYFYMTVHPPDLVQAFQ
jgi:hypothetical protein